MSAENRPLSPQGLERGKMNENNSGVIQLYDGWVIIVDSRQWILARDTGKKDKNGAPIRNIRGYYTRLGTALKACAEANIRAGLQNGTTGLSEALQTIHEEHERLEKFIADNIPNV